MNIDIYDYFDRWMVNYIVYHTKHLQEYGDPRNAINMFSASYETAIDKINSRLVGDQILSTKEQMKIKGVRASQVLRLVNQLQRGTLLESTLDQLVESLWQGAETEETLMDFDRYNNIVYQAKQLSGAFQNGNTQQMNQFFQLIMQAMQQAKLLDLNVFNALSGIGKQLVGTNFDLGTIPYNLVAPLDEKDMQTAQLVLNTLNTAASDGSITNARSFASRITYIFSTVVGNKVRDMLVAKGFEMAMDEVEKQFEQAAAKSNGKLTLYQVENKFNKISHINFKLFDEELFSVAVRSVDDANYSIEIGTNTDITWAKKGSATSSLKLSGYAPMRMNMAEYFAGDIQGKYLGYNMIAHENSGAEFSQAMEILRGSIAANYFNGWLQQSKKKNFQYILVGQEIFPVARIINNICEEAMRGWGRGNTAFNIDTGYNRNLNKWQGQFANWDWAIKRSEMVNKIIDTFIISANFNENIMLQYAY